MTICDKYQYNMPEIYPHKLRCFPKKFKTVQK